MTSSFRPDKRDVTTDDGTVFRPVVALADPSTGAGVVGVRQRPPGLTEYGLVTRPSLPSSQFGEVLSVARSPIVELNSANGVSALRNLTTLAGTGAVAASATGEIQVSTGATSSSSALLESSRGRYMPGTSAQVGVGVRIAENPTGAQVGRWGAFTSAEGVFFGIDATGLFVARRRDSSDTIVRQADWNIDPLDGTGPSGYTFSIDDGNIFQIDFTWYGYGQIRFSVVATVNNIQRPIPVHVLRIADLTSVQDPSLPVAVQVENGATASDFALFVGGRQYSVVGKFEPSFRFTGDGRGSAATSTTAVPLISFRRKDDFLNRAVKVGGFEVSPSTQTVIVEIRVNGTLTGASWGTPTNYTASETALERDISATAISGGNVLYTQLVVQGTNQTRVFEVASDLNLDVLADQPVTLCARTLTSTGTITSGFRMREEW